MRGSLAVSLFVGNEAGGAGTRSWEKGRLAVQGWMVGRHPLMAADEWGASPATGVRVGWIWVCPDGASSGPAPQHTHPLLLRHFSATH